MANEYWRCLLDLASGVGGAPQPGSVLQYEAIALLIENEFKRLHELMHAELPHQWMGDESASEEVLLFLRAWQEDVKRAANKR